MNIVDVRTLIDYNNWATARILAAAGRLSAEQFNAPGNLSYGGVRGTLIHTFGAECAWRLRAQEGISPASLPGGDLSDLPAMREVWQQEQARMRAWLDGLSDADVQRSFTYTSLKGIPSQAVLWQALVHMVNHGTQHRAEVAVLLTDFGQSPGDVDMILYFREKNA